MKYRILIAVASLLLAALIILLLPPAHPQTDSSIPSTAPTGPAGTTGTNGTLPGTVPSPPDNAGVVRLYSCDADFLPIFTQLAAEYSALTGVEVVVLSPDADGCQATLQRYMESEDPPTVFCIHSQSQLMSWRYTLLNLEGTGLADALCNESLGLWLDGKLMGVPAAVQGFGLLVNAELLGTKGAMSRNDVTDFDSLVTAVQILKNNSVKAFPAAAPKLQDAWYLLMSEDLGRVRAFVDLYLANCNKSGNPMTLFLDGKSAFCPGGTWDYDTLASFTDSTLHVRNLDILPNFSAGAMQYICSTVWCINASARQEDIDTTLAFMKWLVTAGEDSPAPVDRLEVLSPFTDAAWYGNWLENKLRGYMRTEAAVLQWDGGEMGTDPMLMALTAYMENRTDENWQQVELAVQAIRAEYDYPY